ncbi:Octapeptide-repeat protein T2, partial [Ophiophagus hannah]
MKIFTDSSHPGHKLFQLLPSKRRYRAVVPKGGAKRQGGQQGDTKRQGWVLEVGPSQEPVKWAPGWPCSSPPAPPFPAQSVLIAHVRQHMHAQQSLIATAAPWRSRASKAGDTVVFFLMQLESSRTEKNTWRLEVFCSKNYRPLASLCFSNTPPLARSRHWPCSLTPLTAAPLHLDLLGQVPSVQWAQWDGPAGLVPRMRLQQCIGKAEQSQRLVIFTVKSLQLPHVFFNVAALRLQAFMTWAGGEPSNNNGSALACLPWQPAVGEMGRLRTRASERGNGRGNERKRGKERKREKERDKKKERKRERKSERERRGKEREREGKRRNRQESKERKRERERKIKEEKG